MTAEVPTRERLAAALAAIKGGIPPGMIAKAEQGYYHDFESPLAFPELQLVADLRACLGTPGASNAAIKALVADVIDGKYDATKAESDAWAASPEGQQVFRDLLGGGGKT